MARKLPHKDVVVIGLGWTGAILAYELTGEGLDVVAIERGPWRDTGTDFPPGIAPDELRYHIRHDLFLRPSQTTLTFRNNIKQTALPMRKWDSFMPGNGVGGAGVHWNAETWRFLPTDFVLRSHLEGRYGKSFLPSDMTIQDWGVTYDELEPYYTKFEFLCGTSGQAGNLHGQIQPGGNPFEGPRSTPYPTPPMKQGYMHHLFAEAASKTGHSPFPQPSGNLSESYTNPLGCTLGQCTYCGFCEWFGCGNFSKASPQTTVLPALIRRSNFEARTECEVTRINLDNTGKRATGVTYVDTSGQEWEQPADLVLVCAFQLWNVHLFLTSGIGTPYDPQSGQGVVGRNFSYQVTSSVNIILKDKTLNPYMSAGAIGMCIDDYNGDNFDHGPYGFVGGGYMGCVQTNARPINTQPLPKDTPKWGAQWKRALHETYPKAMTLSTHGSCYSYRDAWLDLDPTYKDRYGRPLLRMTFDFHDNELKMSQFLTDRLAEVGQALDPAELVKKPRTGPYTSTEYQTTHTCGGLVMGTDPKTSVVNRYLQSWDVSNVFVPGSTSAYPQNAGYNPTTTVGALAYWCADAIKSQYLKKPGPLVQA